MNPNDVNILLLETVAQHLGAELLERMVFVGGAWQGYSLQTLPCLAYARLKMWI